MKQLWTVKCEYGTFGNCIDFLILTNSKSVGKATAKAIRLIKARKPQYDGRLVFQSLEHTGEIDA